MKFWKVFLVLIGVIGLLMGILFRDYFVPGIRGVTREEAEESISSEAASSALSTVGYSADTQSSSISEEGVYPSEDDFLAQMRVVLSDEIASRSRRSRLKELFLEVPVDYLFSKAFQEALVGNLSREDIADLGNVISLKLMQEEDLSLFKKAATDYSNLFYDQYFTGLARGLSACLPFADVASVIEEWDLTSDVEGRLTAVLGSEIGFRRPDDAQKILSSGATSIAAPLGEAVFRGWIGKQPSEATVWLLDAFRRDSGDAVSSSLLKDSFSAWCLKDSHVAAQFLLEQSASAERDVMIHAMIDYLLLMKDRESASLWAREIGESLVREQVLRRIGFEADKQD